MQALKTVVGSLLLTGLVWLAFSWPLPRYLADGIPSSSANVEKSQVRRMIPGDHLQLLYSYWLFADMLAGKTPWGGNLYEFNTGADAERRGGGSYADAPFSLVYALIAGIGNRAVGWNLTGLIALWLTHLFTWLLLRSYLKSDWAAALLALIAVAFPYRWAMLCGGSPTGFAMAWPPLLLWGLDAAIRRFSLAGGCGAALALLFAYWNDGHIFFFSVLLIPAWCLLTVLHSEHLSWTRFRTWRNVVLALSPLLALALAVVLAGLFKHATQFTDTTMAGGRSWPEVALYSFPAAALLAWRGVTPGSPVYIGVILPLALAAGLILQVIVFIRRPQMYWRAALVFLLLLLGIALILVLTLGTRGPWDGQFLECARCWIPPYRMIRQPAKILTILPPLLAVAAALSLTQISAGVAAVLSAARRRAQAGGGGNNIDVLELGYNDAAGEPTTPQGLRWTGGDIRFEDKPILVGRPDSLRGRDPARGQRLTGFMALFCVLILADYGWQIKPTICRLDHSQAAYAVAAEDARAQNRAPHILVLPIWPGDSAWASLYEYYVSLYRIRMINGYQPVVPRRYIEQIFQPLENFNCGIVTDAQLDDLARRGIAHVLLHEDAFPEKVSYFPVAFTLKRLLNHPRLELICQARNVWAFKILPAPRPREPVQPDWAVFFPNLFYEMEWLAPAGRAPVADPSASGGQLVRLDAPVILTAKPFEHLNAPDPFLLLRCRGQGQLAVSWRLDDGICRTQAVNVAADRWQWTAVPLGEFGNSRRIQPELAWVSGTVEADLMLYSSGKLPDLKPGESVSLPAPLFFHAGYTDLENDSVRLRPDYDPADRIFYGPKLPLPDGRYQAQLRYETPAPVGTALGSFRIEIGDQPGVDVPLTAGGTAMAEFSTVKNNLPVTLGFFYARTADLEIQQVVFTRVE